MPCSPSNRRLALAAMTSTCFARSRSRPGHLSAPRSPACAPNAASTLRVRRCSMGCCGRSQPREAAAAAAAHSSRLTRRRRWPPPPLRATRPWGPLTRSQVTPAPILRVWRCALRSRRATLPFRARALPCRREGSTMPLRARAFTTASRPSAPPYLAARRRFLRRWTWRRTRRSRCMTTVTRRAARAPSSCSMHCTPGRRS